MCFFLRCGATDGEGIQLAGLGNVICHNRMTGFRDCLSTMENASASNQMCVDMYGNDIYRGCDDGIEADFTMGNCRVIGNRLTNCFVALSAQPTLGGPLYFIRNAMYNIVHAPFKLHRATTGDVALHNTIVKCGDAFGCYTGDTWTRAFFRNNIFISGTGGGTYGGYSNNYGHVVTLEAADTTCSFELKSAPFAIFSSGPDLGFTGNQRYDQVAGSLNQDNMVGLGQ